MAIWTRESLGITVPRISASSVAYRNVEVSTEPSNRTSSSTAPGISRGSRRSFSSWSGWRRRSRTEFPIWYAVVLWPAKNRTHSDETRSVSSRASSAVMRSLRKLSDGLARVWATSRASRFCSHSSAVFSSALIFGLNRDRVTTPNCSRSSGRSASSIPMSSHRTAMGSGNAKEVMRSTVPLARHCRRSPSAISVILGRISSTRRG